MYVIENRDRFRIEREVQIYYRKNRDGLKIETGVSDVKYTSEKTGMGLKYNWGPAILRGGFKMELGV